MRYFTGLKKFADRKQIADLMRYIVEVMMMKRSYLMKDGERHSLMVLDEDNGRIYMDGKRVAVTGQEFCLLKELCTHPDEPVSRETILKNAWGFLELGVTRTVDVHIQRLRKKIGHTSIQTVYKYGYKLCAVPA